MAEPCLKVWARLLGGENHCNQAKGHAMSCGLIRMLPDDCEHPVTKGGYCCWCSSRVSIMDHRHVCTEDDPWSREKSFYGDHPDAAYVSTSETDGGHSYLCPHCGLQFREWDE